MLQFVRSKTAHFTATQTRTLRSRRLIRQFDDERMNNPNDILSMLNPQSKYGLTSIQRTCAGPGPVPDDTAVMERMRRHEEAELLARVGVCEITTGSEPGQESQHWSAGMYAILRRDRSDPPLARIEYILHYVHPTDQKRVLGVDLRSVTPESPVDIAYRIVRDDGCVSTVTERLTLIATTATERLLFGDLKEVSSSGPGFATKPLADPTARISNGPTAKIWAETFVFKQYPEPLQAIKSQSTHELLSTFEAFREREQQRIAREMHDDFGQLLAAMKLDLCMLQKKLAQSKRSDLQEVDNLHELVDAMIASTRRIIAELPPKAIDELGLFAALDQLVAGFCKRHPLQMSMRLAPPPIRLQPDIELAAYRVLQEALNNIARHAEATTVDIDVNCSPTDLLLHVTDNGKGASAADISKNESFGLAWMQERVEDLAGSISIQSAEGKGTSISVSLPLRPAAGPHSP